MNVGGAGTFVVRRRVRRADLRAVLRRHLPFAAEIIVCEGARIRALLARHPSPWAGSRLRPDVVRFVTILGARPDVEPLLPLTFGDGRRWLVRLLARTDCFLVGVYRRHMKTIGCLGRIDRLFEVPVTTRSWSTLAAVAAVLDKPLPRRVASA